MCHNSNNISTHRLFIQCFWELLSVMLLLFSCLEFSTFMRYNVFVWCLVQAEVYMHFLIMRCMTKLFTTSSFPVSQDQALYMCTPS